MKRRRYYKIYLFFIIILLFFILFLLGQKRDNQMIQQIQFPADRESIYTPPLYGIPINRPTNTIDVNYKSIGVLSRINGKETLLPLFGRPLHLGRGKWQYYAMGEKNDHIKLPVVSSGKSCTGERGCDMLNNGDIIYVEGYNTAFKATIYENESPRYIPFI
jgi:hypothetical protein